MKEKYKDYLLYSSIYKVYNGKSGNYYDYYDKVSKYYYALHFVESEEDIKAKKMANCVLS